MNETAWTPFSQPVWGRLRVELDDGTDVLIMAFLAWRMDGGIQYLSSNGFSHPSSKVYLIRPEEIK